MSLRLLAASKRFPLQDFMVEKTRIVKDNFAYL